MYLTRVHWVFFVPFFIQAAFILFDEFYFHQKRGVLSWERIAHPMDTLSVILCLSYTLIFPFAKETFFPFIVLGTISTLLITKDAFIEKEAYEAQEQWLHALLIINHLLVLICIGWLWAHGEPYYSFLSIQLIFAVLFCLYQLVYWNLIWKERK